MKPVFDKYGAVLIHAIASLCRQGFPISPRDGMELINDFCDEVWPKLVSRSRERVALPVMYDWFMVFARPRIVRNIRWQTILDIPEFSGPGDSGTAALETLSTRIDLQPVLAAIRQLSEHQRAILRHLFQRSNEKPIAGTTSYRMRCIQIEALGFIATTVYDHRAMPEDDWHIAVCLWSELRTVPEAARYLGITETDIRSARTRIVKILRFALSQTRIEASRPSQKVGT